MGNLHDKDQGKVQGHASTGDSRKHLCILYNGSDKRQKKNAKSFRDALRGGEGGKNMKIQFIDVSHHDFDGLEWLRQIQHVLVVCVNNEDTGKIKKVLDKEGIKNGGPEETMHAKVLTVSFGTDPPQRIMGDFLRRMEVSDTKDFCFNFQNLDDINANDFDRSDEMKKLRTTIISVMDS